MKMPTLALASSALLGMSPLAEAAIIANVTQFSDTTFATFNGVTNSNSNNYIALPPTSSTAHNYQAYNTGEEVRMYATAYTSPNTSLGFAFGNDGAASYSLNSSSNPDGVEMRVGATFHFSVDLTNSSTDWLDLTMGAWHGMRYGMFHNIFPQTGLAAGEYMHLNADFSLRVDGVEVWERVFDRLMDTSGNNPYAVLSNQNPPSSEVVSAISLGTWAPNETRTMELLFSGFAETNVDASRSAILSMAPLFNYRYLDTALGEAPEEEPTGGNGGSGNTGGGANAVPEPSALALLGLGLGLMGWAARRQG